MKSRFMVKIGAGIITGNVVIIDNKATIQSSNAITFN